jgi:phage shock protein C
MAEKVIPEKRLTKSATNRVFAGVAGGLGEYFGIDPTFVRLAFVLFAFYGGFGLIAYIALALFMPENSSYKGSGGNGVFSEVGPGSTSGRRPGFWLGVVLLTLGVLILLDRLDIFNRYIPNFRWDIFWPAALIFLGIWLLSRR